MKSKIRAWTAWIDPKAVDSTIMPACSDSPTPVKTMRCFLIAKDERLPEDLVVIPVGTVVMMGDSTSPMRIRSNPMYGCDLGVRYVVEDADGILTTSATQYLTPVAPTTKKFVAIGFLEGRNEADVREQYGLEECWTVVEEDEDD